MTEILVATSGDTGKAALAGYAGPAGHSYRGVLPQRGHQRGAAPADGHAGREITWRCMPCRRQLRRRADGREARCLPDEELRAWSWLPTNEQLSSANSINWGRLVPQIVYYFYSYAQLVRSGGYARPGAARRTSVCPQAISAISWRAGTPKQYGPACGAADLRVQQKRRAHGVPLHGCVRRHAARSTKRPRRPWTFLCPRTWSAFCTM